MSNAASFDYLVLGAGVAGLRAAITLAEHGQVLIVTKEALRESNTHYAQGGIAVATEDREDIALHLKDTVNAGDGLVYQPAAKVLVEEGPERVAELIAWGAGFDRQSPEQGGQLLRTREAAHSRPRILHANGDATGAEIGRALAALARNHPRIQFAEWTMAVNLIAVNGRIIAADLISANSNPPTNSGAPSLSQQPRDKGGIRRIYARAILIATGGAGQVYSDTTNPAVATGDGISLAAHAGAELSDMEFYQFHPTALSLPGVPRFLLSEALRGEGAYLRNDRDERFMERYHPSLELAPRDVVARAIAREGMSESTAESRLVYLDLRHVTDINLAVRFPGISHFLARHDLDLSRDLIPVRPAAHYLMGGIRTDLDGRTTLKGLYAAGEAACTGVHGANRLASNSLLEGLVFGARTAQAMLHDKSATAPATGSDPADFHVTDQEEENRIEELIAQLKRMMWRTAGLLREEQALREGIAERDAIEASIVQLAKEGKLSRNLFEAQSLLTVSRAILLSSLARTESRGAHFREDYPKRNDAQFQKHSLEQNGKVRFEA